MNYKELIEAFRECALTNGVVNSFLCDEKDSLNNLQNIQYPVILLTPATHQIEENLIEYTFSLLYADLLTDDNKNETHSIGIQIVKQILNRMSGEYDVDINYPLEIDLYSENIPEQYAGVVCTCSIEMEDSVGICYE